MVRRFILFLFLFLSLFLSFVFILFSYSNNSFADTIIEEVRIADGKGDWGYPNPYRHYPRGPGYIRMSWVFDTLIWKNRDGDFIPALSQSWSYDKRNLSYLFKLNKNALFHDGKKVTAKDVVFTINYMKKHPYRWVNLSNIKDARALSEYEVLVSLKKPYSPFLSEIGGTMPVLPEHIWKSIEKPESFDGKDAFTGSGPYIFKDFNRAKKTYLFESFDKYYQGKPKARRIIYIKSGNPIMALMGGKASLSSIKPEMVKILKAKGFKIIADKAGWNKKLMINHRVKPFSDVRFRRALAYIINREEIIEKSHRGFGRVASLGLLSKDHSMFNPDTPMFDFNPSKAEALFKEMGYRKDSDGYYSVNGKVLKINLLASNITVAGDSVNDRDGEIIKKQFEDFGIKTELIHLEQATIDARVKNWDFMLAVSGHGGIMGDPKILNEMISSRYKGSVNSARFDDVRLNDLLEKQLGEMDVDRRKLIVYEIQRLHAELLPAIPLYYPDTYSAYNPSSKIEWFYTSGGISKGIPISQNKMALID